MRAFVFTDRALERYAGQFVWLAINTEKRENAFFRKQFSIQALPTYFVLSPSDTSVVLRWVGGATVGRLQEILDDTRSAFSAAREGRGGGQGEKEAVDADALLVHADELYGEGENTLAATEYHKALAAAPEGWPAYGRAVESLLFAQLTTEEYEACAEFAREVFPRLRATPSAANVAAMGLEAALELPADHARRGDLIAALEDDARVVVEDLTIPLPADDRSGTFGMLVDARRNAGDEEGARDVAARWLSFLDGEAARARTPEERTVFDSHRLSACLELGTPERAIPMLEAAESDFPGDYNPPARLSLVYKELGRWDEGLAASDRALARAYGPRQLSILQTRADLFAGKGDRRSAIHTLQQALELAKSLPAGQRSESRIQSLQKKLDALAAP